MAKEKSTTPKRVTKPRVKKETTIVRAYDPTAPLQDSGYLSAGAGIVAPLEVLEGWGVGQDTVGKDGFFSLPAIKRGVELISNKVASCSCRIIEHLENGGHQLAKQHNWYRAVNKQANGYLLSSNELYKQLVIDCIWSGNAYAYITPDYRLVPLDPQSVYPVILTTYDKQEVVYAYQQNNDVVALDASSVIHIKSGLTSHCGLKGMSLIDHCKTSLNIQINAQKYASAFYKFGGIADCWVEIAEGSAVDDETQRLILKKLQQRFSGVENSHSPIVFTGGAKLNKTYLNNSDAQFLESRQFSLVDIANLLNIVVSKLNGTQNTSYNSLSAENTAILSDTYEPYLTSIERQLSLKLLKEYEQDTFSIEFDRNDLTKGDAKSETEHWILKLSNGLCSWQEYRIATGQSIDIEDDDIYFHPAQWAIGLNTPSTPQQGFAPANTPAPATEPTEEDIQQDVKELAERGKDITLSAFDRIKKRLQKHYPTSKDDLIHKHEVVIKEAIANDIFVDDWLEQLGDEINNVLPEQRKQVIDNIDTNKLTGKLWKM